MNHLTLFHVWQQDEENPGVYVGPVMSTIDLQVVQDMCKDESGKYVYTWSTGWFGVNN